MNKPLSAADSARMAQAANMQNRAIVLQQGQRMKQSIFNQPVANPLGAVVNVPIRNVGLVTKLVIEITGTIAKSDDETLTRTKFAGANVLSNVTLTDLSNQTRIDTSGAHLHFLATAKGMRAYGAAFTSDSPAQIGSVYPVNTMPSPVTTAQNFRWYVEIPLAYSEYDLRGALYMNVVNATANLQMTINPNFVLASTADETMGVYKSSSAKLGTLSNVQVNVYQYYIDQIPIATQGGQSQPILPLLDLAYNYLLNNTAFAAIAEGQDNPIQFANFRQFMSCFAVYDNAALNAGTDINYWGLQVANYTNIFKLDPFTVALETRKIIGDDMPAGVYYFDFREKPVNTIQYGNQQLIFSPSDVQVGAQVLVWYEALAIANQVTNAGSLYAQ